MNRRTPPLDFQNIMHIRALEEQLERDIAEAVAGLRPLEVRNTIALVVLGLFLGTVAMLAQLFIDIGN